MMYLLKRKKKKFHDRVTLQKLRVTGQTLRVTCDKMIFNNKLHSGINSPSG